MATDFTTTCSGVALNWLQMLASAIRGYQVGGVTHYRINSIVPTANCGGLTDSITCNMNIDPERLLVENVFALDDCGYLALKIFSNQDNDWIDYAVCNEAPQSFLQMLARSMVTYAAHTRINSVIDTGACTSVTALLNCNTNQIESERLLVTNVFATDDCGKLLIKLFSSSSTMTDYHTGCGAMAETFIELLARSIVRYNGHYYLNIAFVTGYCGDLLDFWTCSSFIDSERALVENLFATDSCGNLALKVFNNSGEEQ